MTGKPRHGSDEDVTAAAALVASNPPETRCHEFLSTGKRLIEHRACSARGRLTGKLRTMTTAPAACQKQRARAHRARVERHVADLERPWRIEQPGGELRETCAACWCREGGRFHCSEAVRTSSGCSTGSSGSTAIRRRARPTTLANTGAETSPPM